MVYLLLIHGTFAESATIYLGILKRLRAAHPLPRPRDPTETVRSSTPPAPEGLRCSRVAQGVTKYPSELVRNRIDFLVH